jgi:type VI secretion system protein
VRRPLALVAVILLGLSGCARPCLLDQTGSMTVTAAADANQTSATAVDVTATTETALADRLAGLDASTYFATREQLLRDHPATLTVTGWEVAPGQSVGPEPLRFACRTDAVFVFASIRAPGAHRVRLDSLKGLRVDIGREAIEVTR